MKWIPYDKFRLETQLKPEEIMEIMQKNTLPGEISPWNGTIRCRKKFVGAVEQNGFRVARWFDDRAHFNPVISGEVTTAQECTIVEIKQTMHLYVQVFMAMFLLGAIGCPFEIYMIMWLEGYSANPLPVSIIVGCFAICFVYLIFNAYFWFHAGSTQQMFERLFKVKKD